MGKVESILKSEIMRLAKREMRAAFLPLKKEVWKMKIRLSGLAKSFASVERQAKEQMRREESQKLKLEGNLEEAKISRFTPERIRGFRQKLGISQRELALLTGVTLGAVGSWEKGKFRPTLAKKSILVALRKMGKRDVRKILTEKMTATKKTTPKAIKARRRNVKKTARRKK
jgi:DNA-binding transcriptional regulator YiaG